MDARFYQKKSGLWVALLGFLSLSSLSFSALAASAVERELITQNNANLAAEALSNCTSNTQLVIYTQHTSRKEVDIPVRINLVNSWLNQNFKTYFVGGANYKYMPKQEGYGFSKLWRNPHDFAPVSQVAKKCLVRK